MMPLLKKILGCRRVAGDFPFFQTDRGSFFVKRGDPAALAAEARGLKEIGCYLRVPEVFACQEGFLVLEALDLRPHTDKTWAELGEGLAKMHLEARGKFFGWPEDNWIGLTPQVNEEVEDWVGFFVDKRLRFQLSFLKQDKELQNLGEKFCEKFPEFFRGLKLFPSLLHGDLWHGNTGVSGEGGVVFDPACYFGHHEAEFGMIELFGGFARPFFDSYRDQVPKDECFEERLVGYKLYHALNHYNLFGAGYRTLCISLLESI